eukprot:758352-Hanusia_phi.AAC.1
MELGRERERGGHVQEWLDKERKPRREEGRARRSGSKRAGAQGSGNEEGREECERSCTKGRVPFGRCISLPTAKGSLWGWYINNLSPKIWM